MTDDLRDRLADALRKITVPQIAGPESHMADNLAAALLPTVERIARERAADEIRAIAHRIDNGGEESRAVTREGAPYVHRVLCDCAHALDGKP